MIDLAIALLIAWACAYVWLLLDHRLRRRRAAEEHELAMERMRRADEGSTAAHERMRDIIRRQAEASLRFADAIRPDHGEDEPWKGG